jgi:hypothetical protein
LADFEDLKSRSERLAAGPRLTEIDRLAVALENAIPAPNEGDLAALTMLLTDAILDWDEAALEFALAQLPRLAALAGRDDSREGARTEGRLLALLEVAQQGLQRVPPSDFLGHVESGSHSHKFLQEIEREPMRTNLALSLELEVGESEVSRIGRRLIQAGLARKRRLGRTNQWLITPRGVQVLSVLEAGGVDRPTREHRQYQT